MKNPILENYFKLSSKVTVYVPSTTDVNKEIDNTLYVNSVAANLSTWFGGATSANVSGFWMSDTHGLVQEKTTTVYAYCDENALQENLENLLTMCQKMKNDLVQESVGVEIDGEMYFI